MLIKNINKINCQARIYKTLTAFPKERLSDSGSGTCKLKYRQNCDDLKHLLQNFPI